MQWIIKRGIKIITKPKELLRIPFRADGTAVLFEHVRGENTLRKIVRTTTAFTIMNVLLWTAERQDPLFGAWSETSFIVCTMVGFIGLCFLHMFSRRCIRNLTIRRHSDLVHL